MFVCFADHKVRHTNAWHVDLRQLVNSLKERQTDRQTDRDRNNYKPTANKLPLHYISRHFESGRWMNHSRSVYVCVGSIDSLKAPCGTNLIKWLCISVVCLNDKFSKGFFWNFLRFYSVGEWQTSLVLVIPSMFSPVLSGLQNKDHGFWFTPDWILVIFSDHCLIYTFSPPRCAFRYTLGNFG